ncbi:uncharacterized protein EMH_0036000 [Eimeria mitis]|uniref:SAG family member n=1 Tax=Eimeria mitis TaxID=44415 RepID=U6JT14_9EIME|nr:uncharacterized protein EMH_0036000 [Eimeria mitis]CDJ27906.1 hypothetical protein EMH_0036000 [Eimeria mitis]
MASLYRTAAAVCLVALSVLQAQAQGNTATYKFTVEKVDEDAYVAANLARNGKLPVHISGVAKADNLVSSLTDKVKAATGAADATCSALIKDDLKAVFHRSFDYSEAPNYRKLLQEALEDGLKIFDEEYFNGLITRTTELEDMTEDDLKVSVGNGVAAAAVPTILIAGFVAMLAAVSA